MSFPGQLYDVGGRSLHAVVRGAGDTTVLLEAGGFAWSSDWEPVTALLVPQMRTVAYDRAGLGWSDRGPAPRDLSHHVSDLEMLIQAARLEPPFVVVGASYGGHIARAFAARRPEAVKGMVLADARPPDMARRMPAAWARLERGGVATARAMRWLAATRLLPLVGKLMGERALPPAARALPPELRESYLRDCFGPDAWQTSLEETQAIAASDRQAAAIGSHGDLPLHVLVHDVPDLFAPLGADLVGAEQAWLSMQEDLAALSSRSTLRIVSGAGHAIQHDRPDAVAEAIRSLLAS